MRTLGARVVGLDAARFVNRAGELGLLERLLDDGARVVLVHGPGGVGKSALLREFARRARARGRSVYWVEGRELAPAPDILEDLLSGIDQAPRPVIVLDTYERIEALGGYLRRVVLPDLPAEALVVIAGRCAPGAEWRQGGWENVAVDMRLEGLCDADAREVLSRHGITSPSSAEQIIAWAHGSPLALTLAAQAAQQSPTWDDAAESPDLVRAIVSRLADPELDPEHAPTLWLAATARVTTLALLRAALPDADAREELRWLASRTFAEPLGDGIALHELVAEALHQELVHRDPLRERDLRRRICDHLYARARRGDLLLTIDLAHLSQSAAIRWGFAWQPATRFHLDDLRPGDAEQIHARLNGTWHEQLLPGTDLFIERAPEHIITVRDSQDRLRGYTIALSPPDAPDFCSQDPLLGPRLDHARLLADPGEAVIWRDVVDIGAQPEPVVISMLGMGGVLRAAHGNPRYAYLPINPLLPGALEFSQALNGGRVEELDARFGKARIECHIVDYGPEGLLGAQRDLIYRELGLAPPASAQTPRDLARIVREALRNLDRPHALARSELATGETLHERAASVRASIDEAIEHAFGPGPGEQLSRQALILGYLQPAASHELAARQLSLSRAAYFRRLKRGADQIANYIDAKQAVDRLEPATR